MVSRSSTSSSEDRPRPVGFPWAAALAVLLVLGFEVGVRQLPPSALIPYRVGIAVEYDAVATVLETFGTADICFLGSSRARDAIICSEVQNACQQRANRPVEVASYACAGAKAIEMEAVVGAALRDGQPALFLYGLTPYQLVDSAGIRDDVALFWDWTEWQRKYPLDPSTARSLLPIVIRNELGDLFHTLKYRKRAGALVGDLLETAFTRRRSAPPLMSLLNGTAMPCPALGGRSRVHFTRPDQTLLSKPPAESSVKAHVDRIFATGRFSTDGEQMAALKRLVDACRARGVEVILYELPVSDLYAQFVPPEVQGAFQSAMRTLGAREGVTYLSFADLGVQFTDEHFLDSAHLNLRGANVLTERLTEIAIVDALQRHRPAEGK